ncbi:MAG: Rpn family recombination-promoting nuclease/putative transposase [Lachnospiraceae bacterium]|nr:Rpn family recombination-promoting nuclease/putative transposase [Lachnospiraceae bacterium]MCM1279463.1 Rpn family recombination-promoting nuclease/putative transposase [Robinsoniella sp.]
MTEKAFEELQIKDDFMFSVIMRNPKFCKPFLERILNIKISHIEYPKSQAIIDISADAKSVRLDIYVEDGKETVYNIEMQTTENRNLPKRTRYYQGMIDLNILEKGDNYKDLKRSFVILVCTFDLFGEGRHIYTFENRCIQNLELSLGDDTTKIILNTKGTMDDVTPEMKKLLDFIDGKEPEDDFTRELDEAVQSVRKNEKWRLDYMTLQMNYQEKYEQGVEQEKRQSALRMIEAGKLSSEEIALYSGLSLERVFELEKELQPV